MAVLEADPNPHLWVVSGSCPNILDPSPARGHPISALQHVGLWVADPMVRDPELGELVVTHHHPNPDPHPPDPILLPSLWLTIEQMVSLELLAKAVAETSLGTPA